MLSPRDKIIKAKISPLTVFNTELECSNLYNRKEEEIQGRKLEKEHRKL